MIGARHRFVLQPLALPAPQDSVLARATEFESIGNWYLAGETYIALKDTPDPTRTPNVMAQLLARAASCFEIAQDTRAAARLYDEAARVVSSLNLNPQLSAELYNRAALQYRESSEFFFAGSAWVRTAEEFGKVPADVINCSENLSPLPMSAFKSHLCGSCFEAAAAVYEKATGEEMWSVGVYWRAGAAYSAGPPNIQAFNAYRRALVAAIEHYSTLKVEDLRRFLPLSQRERDDKINPTKVMEAALVRCNNHHQPSPGDTPQSRIDTYRQMAAAFHEFTLCFQSMGNANEAGIFRAAQNEQQRKIYWLEGNYRRTALYSVWRLTSNYGESLIRWACTCVLVILTFAVAYRVLGAVESTVEPVSKPLHFFDYIYFSVITFSTLGYGDLHPVGFLGQALTCIEVLAGFIMFGVLLSFVGTRFQRG